MVGLVTACTLAVWAHPLAFRPAPGWRGGASGTVRSAYVPPSRHVPVPKESTAWTAIHVRYRDPPTADPPNRTLAHLPRNAVIVWAVIFDADRPHQKPIRLRFGLARRFDCCEATYVAGGDYELAGRGPKGGYSVIVRIYFGSPPTRSTRLQAQRALDRLKLPPLR
jgi:hypothetical protein